LQNGRSDGKFASVNGTTRMRTAKQLIESFDTIGKRTQTEAGGDQTGANLRLAHYTNNVLNQISSRDVPGDVDVMGLLLASNTVTVNSNTPYRRGEYFRDQLAVTNTSAAVWTNITVASPGQASVSGHVYVARTPETNTYDLDGNLLSDGRWTYSWDAENRLTNMTSLSGAPSGSQLNLSFVYDYMGRRIQKVVSTNNSSSNIVEYTDNYAYDGWNFVAILNSSLGLVNSFLWGTDLSGSMQGAGGVGGLVQVNYYGSSATNGFVAYDGNGNVVALVNAADGSTLSLYDYGPFGEVIRATGPMAKLNPFRFSTKYDDDESDFLYYGYRYYNPNTGKWVGRDPVEEDGGLNLYDFIQNNAINAIDMLGMWQILRASQNRLADAYPDSGDTIRSLASQIHLSTTGWRTWLGGASDVPNLNLDTPLAPCLSFTVPNTIYVDLGVPLEGESMHWVYHFFDFFNLNRRAAQLEARFMGFAAPLMGLHTETKIDATGSDIWKHLHSTDIYAYVFAGHGANGDIDTPIVDDESPGDYTQYGIAGMMLISCQSAGGAGLAEWPNNVATTGHFWGYTGNVYLWTIFTDSGLVKVPGTQQ
jgi:RHS repeat-associated protein